MTRDAVVLKHMLFDIFKGAREGLEINFLHQHLFINLVAGGVAFCLSGQALRRKDGGL